MSKGDRTRQRIIAQAAPLFNQKGYEGCSMQDVMEATGLEKGGLYRHFAGKEELAAAVLRYSLDLAIRSRIDGVERISGAAAKLQYIIHRFVEMQGPIAGGCPLLNAAVDADDGNPALRKLARQAFSDWKSGLIAILREGMERGEIRRTVNAEQLANTILAALEGGIALSRMENSREALRSVEASLLILIEAATTPGGGPTSPGGGQGFVHDFGLETPR
jgi:TetR/AcrR family transcriptional repressor of nem operon